MTSDADRAREVVETWTGGVVFEHTDGQAPRGTNGDLVHRIAQALTAVRAEARREEREQACQRVGKVPDVVVHSNMWMGAGVRVEGAIERAKALAAIRGQEG